MIHKISTSNIAFKGYLSDAHAVAKKDLQNMHWSLTKGKNRKNPDLRKIRWSNFRNAQERFEYLDWLKQCAKATGVPEETIEAFAYCNHSVNCPQELPEKCSFKKGDNAETEFFIERAIAFLTDAKRDYPNLTQHDLKVLLAGLKRDLKIK